MSDAGVLVAHTPADWSALCSVLHGFECAWADVDGWHEGACPQEQPPGATHMWGWQGNRAVLARVGNSRIVCAELRMSAADAAGDDQVAVRVSTYGASVWKDGENGMSVPTRTTAFELLAVEGVSTVWFVRPR